MHRCDCIRVELCLHQQDARIEYSRLWACQANRVTDFRSSLRRVAECHRSNAWMLHQPAGDLSAEFVKLVCLKADSTHLRTLTGLSLALLDRLGDHGVAPS
jgi:hypothetical protein